MSTQLLFVYGTLLDESTQAKVIGRSIGAVADVLPDFTKQTIEVHGQVYPCAVATKEHTIRGMTLEVSEDELQKIDEYETAAYERRQVVLASGKAAWVYTRP